MQVSCWLCPMETLFTYMFGRYEALNNQYILLKSDHKSTRIINEPSSLFTELPPHGHLNPKIHVPQGVLNSFRPFFFRLCLHAILNHFWHPTKYYPSLTSVSDVDCWQWNASRTLPWCFQNWKTFTLSLQPGHSAFPGVDMTRLCQFYDHIQWL